MAKLKLLRFVGVDKERFHVQKFTYTYSGDLKSGYVRISKVDLCPFSTKGKSYVLVKRPRLKWSGFRMVWNFGPVIKNNLKKVQTSNGRISDPHCICLELHSP